MSRMIEPGFRSDREKQADGRQLIPGMNRSGEQT